MAQRSAIWEASYPYVIAAIVGGLISRLPQDTPVKLKDAGYNLTGLYSTAQNFEFFATGVLFSVFVFTMAPAAGFVAKLQSLRLFKTFRRYTVEAMAIGLIGCFLLIPITSIDSSKLGDAPFPLLSVLSLSALCAFTLSTGRVIRIFLFWAFQAERN